MEKEFNLEAEEICGHYVSKKMKNIWYVEMDILKELQRVCKKYNITYFASDGTLLGAVRHKGFIPWDDDIDVYMLAEDYAKFCKVAPKEIAYPYFFQSCETEESGFSPCFSRIRRSDTTACTEQEYKRVPKEYNCGIFLDIFPLYNIPKNKYISAIQRIVILVFKLGISGFELKRRINCGEKLKKNYYILAVWYWNLINLFFSYKSLSKIIIFLSSLFKKSDYVGITGYDLKLFNSKLIYQSSYFDKTVEMPFENMTITCPLKYDQLLKYEYGDYMVFVKGTAVHTMTLVDPKVPFKEKLKNI